MEASNQNLYTRVIKLSELDICHNSFKLEWKKEAFLGLKA